jgi:hypothetical protein
MLLDNIHHPTQHTYQTHQRPRTGWD